MTSSSHRFSGLEHLLKAPSKQFVEQLFVRTFHMRLELNAYLEREASSNENSLLNSVAQELEITEEDGKSLLRSVMAVISECLFNNLTTPEEISRIFPSSFHSNLRGLISKLVATHVATWREDAIKSQISLPKLVDLNWRLDIKSASHVMSRMTAPTVIVQMKVQDNMTQKGFMPGVQHVNFELNKETLATMLNGLGKIRDQLGSIQ